MENDKRLDGAMIRDNVTGRGVLVCRKCWREPDTVVTRYPKPYLKPSREPIEHFCYRCKLKVKFRTGKTQGAG